jgi:hypothetical protein
MESSVKVNFIAGVLLGIFLSILYFLFINKPSYILIKFIPPIEKSEIIKVSILVNDLDISFTEFDEYNEKLIKIPITSPLKYVVKATFKNGQVVSGQSGIVKLGYILYENISKEKIVHRIRAR